MKRREWIQCLSSAVLWPLPLLGFAQAGPLRRIGILANASAQPNMPAPVLALVDALRELGHIEGRTLKIEYRWAEGKAERLPELAVDLVRSRVELIVATGDGSTRAAMAATRSIPIVMATSGDAVASGFVASLARPGGNVTGMTAINPELAAKRLQLLRELRPRLARLAVLWEPNTHALEMQATQAAAPEFGITVLPVELGSFEATDAAFERIAQARADALLVLNSAASYLARARIVQLAAQQRLPAMYEAREYAAAGGLAAYGVTHVDLFRQSARHIDKILKGAKPADLPVEQPTRIRLTLNRTAADALELKLPPSLLLRADEVIE